MPFVFAGVMCGWTIAYGTFQKRKGARRAAAAGWDIAAGAPVAAATDEDAATGPAPSR